MADHSQHASRRTAARRASQPPWLALLALLAAVLLAACGSAGATSPPSAQTLAQMIDKYAACMRHHGLPDFYPQQQSGSGQPSAESVYIGDGMVVTGVDPTSSTFQRANSACQHLLPQRTLPSAAELRMQLKAALKAVDCLHTHGFPNFPDPSIHDGAVGWQVPGNFDGNSPQFTAARKVCGKIIPPFGQAP